MVFRCWANGLNKTGFLTMTTARWTYILGIIHKGIIPALLVEPRFRLDTFGGRAFSSIGPRLKSLEKHCFLSEITKDGVVPQKLHEQLS
jgi:hypothetical protein